MKTSDFHFDLSPDLIAQQPLPNRGASRMLVVHKGGGKLEHRTIRDLPDYLVAGDVLVVNDTRVFPARVFGHREDTGGQVELLLVEAGNVQGQSGHAGTVECAPPLPISGAMDGGARSTVPPHTAVWRALLRSGFHPRPGIRLILAEGALMAEVVETGEGGEIVLRLESDEPLMTVLDRFGVAPLPPYIKRNVPAPQSTVRDRDRYQTVYAEHTGAVAAPTAGLHFTSGLLRKLQDSGIQEVAVTLHVGPGTFRPVKTERVEDHQMEAERYTVSEDVAAAIQVAKAEHRRVVAVGSTTVRTLETVAAECGGMVACKGRSSLFIYPPYDFRVVDVMLTNFHLPASTLLMMVSALAAPGDADGGRELIMRAYAEAVRERYRFYSYGDCMLIV